MLSRFGLVATLAKSVSVGDVFGRLTVIATGQIPGTYRYMAVCQCSCGSVPKAIRFDGLQNGNVVACGCVQKERTTTHGLSSSPHMKRWRHIMDRCYNAKCRSYKDYGGRGIRVCDAWHDLATFVSQLPDGYFEGAEIDRIDNNGHYEPDNVRWVTRKKNCNNRRSCRVVEYLGRAQTVTEWAEEFGVSAEMVMARIRDSGWDIGRALTEPPCDMLDNIRQAQSVRWVGHVKKPCQKPFVPKTVMLSGETLTIAVLSARTGITPKLLRKRIFERGWAVERAAIP